MSSVASPYPTENIAIFEPQSLSITASELENENSNELEALKVFGQVVM